MTKISVVNENVELEAFTKMNAELFEMIISIESLVDYENSEKSTEVTVGEKLKDVLSELKKLKKKILFTEEKENTSDVIIAPVGFKNIFIIEQNFIIYEIMRFLIEYPFVPKN